jgi:large subunit ribosomal protein L24
MKKVKLKKNDTVVVIAGKDRGRRGRVLRVFPSSNRALVEGVNIVKKHLRPNPSKNIAGGVTDREASIHISNLMLVDPEANVGTRIGRHRGADGRSERIARKSGAVIG